MRAAYYASITHIDHQIGRIILELVERRLMENTVILFVSDHGDMLGDHLQFQKAKPYQGSVHVPMFLSGPQKYVGEWHKRCEDLAELRDIMPTILELAGAPIPENIDGSRLLHALSRTWLHGEHTL